MREHRSPPLLKVLAQRKMAVLLLLGFSSGLPLYLTSKTLQAWLTVEGVDLASIGAVSLLSLPYSLKFLWAPFMDRFVPPFLGRRRGWIVITQVLLMLAIAAMSLHDPRMGLQMLGINTLLIAFFSASQDIAIDAYRVDVLDDRELGAGAALPVLGYRIAMILTGGLALILADHVSWPTVYLLMAVLMVVGLGAAFVAPEPVLRDGPPQTLASAVVDPFREFFGRTGVATGLFILLFIVLYKLSDGLLQNMYTPFLLERGYTQTEIGAIQGVLGLGSTIVGVIAGGTMVIKLGVNRALWVFGGLQILSNLAYYFVARMEKDVGFLTGAIIVENFCTGLVTAGFVAFLMSLCSKRFSATQFALLSSLMAASRDIVVSPAGSIAEATGWPTFFLITIAAGIPALLLLPVFAPWNRDTPLGAAVHTGEVTDHPETAPAS